MVRQRKKGKAVAPSPEPSKSAVDKAARAILEYARGSSSVSQEEALEQFAIANTWRTSHAKPLNSVAMSLRSFARTTNIDASITQRHKRIVRILGKLHRGGTSMRLSQMEDIGGARVVFDSLEDLRTFEAHLRKSWASAIKRSRDYVEDPKADGYRAVHIVVERNRRRIEVQLRTNAMHLWADQVERLSRSTGIELKTGEGPPEVLNYLRLVADMNWSMELGEPPNPSLQSELEAALRELTAGGDPDA